MAAISEMAGSDQSSRRKIGELLRQTRESSGGDIAQIATTLRIRAAYLTAIEESQYDRMPAPVYALGFVRAYANYLGLDGEEAVRRFKQETVDFAGPRGLTFPVPLAERSIPGGTMVLAALILALCGYGLWYYVSTGERARPERVAAVPQDMLPTPPPAPPPDASATPGSLAPASVAPAPAPAAAPASAPTVADTAPPAQADAEASPATVPEPSLTDADSPPAATPPSSASAAAQAPSLVSPAPATDTASAASAAAPPPTATTTASPTAVMRGTTPGKVWGAVGEPSRIVIEVRKDSWIQVRDGSRVLIDKVLHPGDSYRVGDRSGLVLRTGNGSGIDIEVDGRKASIPGALVRHEIALDPDRLIAGTAIAD